MTFTSPTTAQVTYKLLNGNQVLLPAATGQAVLVNGTWMVSKVTFCTLVISATTTSRSRAADARRRGSDASSYIRPVSGFNLADLFELVVDAVPDREAIVSPRAPADLRAARRAGQPAGPRPAPTSASAPATTSACSCSTASEYLEGMLAAFKLSRGAGQRQLPLRRGRAAAPVRRRRPGRRRAPPAVLAARRARSPARRRR